MGEGDQGARGARSVADCAEEVEVVFADLRAGGGRFAVLHVQQQYAEKGAFQIFMQARGPVGWETRWLFVGI